MVVGAQFFPSPSPEACTYTLSISTHLHVVLEQPDKLVSVQQELLREMFL